MGYYNIFYEKSDNMYLYEKDKNLILVYELKERRDKLFNFKRKEMEKNGKDGLVCSILSNDINEIKTFIDIPYFETSDFITKTHSIFKHKKGLKLLENNYFISNRNNIDGLLYQLYCGDYDLYGYRVKKIYDKLPNKVEKYLLQTTSDLKHHKLERFNGESYRFELPNILSIPESIYLLKLLIEEEFYDIHDKNIDEQLSLYDFNDEPIKKLDLETVQFMNKNYLTDNDFEIHDNILKKVRQLQK